jgi:hypothetical protein
MEAQLPAEGVAAQPPANSEAKNSTQPCGAPHTAPRRADGGAQVLRNLPDHLASRVDAMNELIPGVPASQRNLITLLAGVKRGMLCLEEGAGEPSVVLHLLQNKKPKLLADLLGAEEELSVPDDMPHAARPVIARELFEPTASGMLEAVCWAKRSLKRYSEEGLCPDCSNELRAEGMPKCSRCMLKAAVGVGRAV